MFKWKYKWSLYQSLYIIIPIKLSKFQNKILLQIIKKESAFNGKKIQFSLFDVITIVLQFNSVFKFKVNNARIKI